MTDEPGCATWIVIFAILVVYMNLFVDNLAGVLVVLFVSGVIWILNAVLFLLVMGVGYVILRGIIGLGEVISKLADCNRRSKFANTVLTYVFIVACAALLVIVAGAVLLVIVAGVGLLAASPWGIILTACAGSVGIIFLCATYANNYLTQKLTSSQDRHEHDIEDAVFVDPDIEDDDATTDYADARAAAWVAYTDAEAAYTAEATYTNAAAKAAAWAAYAAYAAKAKADATASATSATYAAYVRAAADAEAARAADANAANAANARITNAAATASATYAANVAARTTWAANAANAANAAEADADSKAADAASAPTYAAGAAIYAAYKAARVAKAARAAADAAARTL